MRLDGFLSCRVLLGMVFVMLPFCRCYFDKQEFEDRASALAHIVQYLSLRPDQMNVDGLFGMTLAEAHLLQTMFHPNVEFLIDNFSTFTSSIVNILELLHRIRAYIKNSLKPENSEANSINMVLNEPSIWKRSIFWQRGKLAVHLIPKPGINASNVEDTTFRGTPREGESDHCIGQLLEKNCKMSEECVAMLLREDGSAGYPLAHRVLYLQVAKALRCKHDPKIHYTEMISNFCGQILQNLVDAESTGFPGYSRDLAIEQILLCGMEGFSEFTSVHFAKLLRSWAHPAGCYDAYGFNPNKVKGRRRGRRDSEFMDYNCENHATGLATGALALLVRESVENVYRPMLNIPGAAVNK